jgi:hypothetical protein
MDCFIDFRTSVTADALEEPDDCPCSELHILCDLINAPRITQSPFALYPTLLSISCISATPRASSCWMQLAQRIKWAWWACNFVVVAKLRTELNGPSMMRSRSQIQTAFLRGNLRAYESYVIPTAWQTLSNNLAVHYANRPSNTRMRFAERTTIHSNRHAQLRGRRWCLY